MTQQKTTERARRAASDSLIVERVDEGHRVHSPANGNRVFLVTGTEGDPACTCPEFRSHLDESGWRCKHIEAVFRNGASEEAPEQTLAGQDGNDPPAVPTNGNGHGSESVGSQMLLKRSVSPNGRIDSLSVEFSCPVAPGTLPETVARRAHNILSIQSGIVSYFLSAHGADQEENHRSDQPATNGEAVPATMMGISSTQNGRSLFLTFDVNGETMRFFGDNEQLAEAIRAAGYPNRTSAITKGVRLGLACRVATEPSKDGRYTNVVEVFPPATPTNGNGRRGRR